ncbi:MAG: riboflavin biosynthesis protein RibF [Coriobacteriia bacterium]|nr:riboflavin biosynthesis protein RibF [Coriobacteriia bacterium]MCL2749988.1 riboflavin biosynthesis protein RibF [Coriobacteriia bacterium]
MEIKPYTQDACVCAIGVFDGVHLGHQALLNAAIADASERGAQPLAVTFDRDPDELFCPDKVHKLLTNQERLEQLKQVIPDVLVLPFTRELASLEWQKFLEMLLALLPSLKAIHVGENFHCGARAAGGINEIFSWGAEQGIEVRPQPLFVFEGATVSATRIRTLLAEGEVKKAAELLTRPFSLTGKVVTGAGRGHSLGFATANVEVDGSSAMMGPYVYAAYALQGGERSEENNGEHSGEHSSEHSGKHSGEHSGKRYKAAVSIGNPPTYSPETQEFNPFLLEAHLIDFEGSIYCSELRLEFVEKLRPMQRFVSTDELISTVKKNISWVRNNL